MYEMFIVLLWQANVVVVSVMVLYVPWFSKDFKLNQQCVCVYVYIYMYV